MEEHYMVCQRVDELSDPVEGSTQTACVDCGGDVWISPESRKEANRLKAMPLCAHCAKQFAEDSVLGMPSEGQFEEVKKVMFEKYPELKAFEGDEKVDPFEALKITAQLTGKLMQDPHAQWEPMAIFVDWEDCTYPPVPLVEYLSRHSKEVVARQCLPALAQAAQARRVLFAFSSWALRSEEEPDAQVPLYEHPDSQETLLLIDLTADGVQQVSIASILRSEDAPPQLGEWMDLPAPAASDGLFVEALVPVLRLIRELREMSLRT